MVNKVEWDRISFEFDEPTRRELKVNYPQFDEEIRKMEMWYRANPKKRKKNHYRFIVNWLNRVKKPVSRDYSIDNKRFDESMKQAIAEASPPPPEWREMMNKIKASS